MMEKMKRLLNRLTGILVCLLIGWLFVTYRQCPDCPPSSEATSSTFSLRIEVAATNQSNTEAKEKLISNISHSTYNFLNVKIDLNTEQFTIVIMTYKRVSLLRIIIPHYCAITSTKLHKIVIIWNDIGTDIPNDIEHQSCSVPLVLIKSKKNKLTNRYIPYSEIETDAVFFIDDDRKILHEDVSFTFESWQQFRHRILGFEFRTHTILPDGEYFYGDKDGTDKNGYSLMGSGTSIIHKMYLHMFQTHIPSLMHEYIDNQMNCEDIAISLMVTDFLAIYSTPQSCCLGLEAKHYPYNLEAQNRGSSYRGLSMRGKKHVQGRSDCLNYFAKFYKNGLLPLVYTCAKLVHQPISSYYTEKTLV